MWKEEGKWELEQFGERMKQQEQEQEQQQ